MDCFAVEAETLGYLDAQQSNFQNIIAVLSSLTRFNQAVLGFFPQARLLKGGKGEATAE